MATPGDSGVSINASLSSDTGVDGDVLRRGAFLSSPGADRQGFPEARSRLVHFAEVTLQQTELPEALGKNRLAPRGYLDPPSPVGRPQAEPSVAMAS